MPSRSALITAFAAIYLIWGSTYLGIRIAIETMPPFLMAGVRFLAAGVVLMAVLRARGAAWPARKQWAENALVGTFLLLGGNGLVAWAEQYIPSGVTALLIGASPLFFVLVEWAWPGGHSPGRITWVGLLLGFAGVAWLAAPWEGSTSGGLNLGALLAILGGSVSWAYGSIYSRHRRDPATPLVAAGAQMLTGGAALLLVALVRGEAAGFSVARVSGESWLAFGYLVLVGSLVAFPVFVWLMKHSTPARVSTYAYVNPVVAVFLGWLIKDEPVGVRTLVAAAIIVTAVAIITTQKNKRTAPGSLQPPAGTPPPSRSLVPESKSLHTAA